MSSGSGRESEACDRPIPLRDVNAPTAISLRVAQLQGDEADPAMASLVRTALAKRIIETAQRPGIDVQKLRDDAIAYFKNNPLWPTP